MMRFAAADERKLLLLAFWQDEFNEVIRGKTAVAFNIKVFVSKDAKKEKEKRILLFSFLSL